MTFEPHANAHDFARYPKVWLASKFMLLLLAGVFGFFWTHSALWYYREFKDHQQRRTGRMSGSPSCRRKTASGSITTAGR